MKVLTMSIKNWYKDLLKKYLRHENENSMEKLCMILSRIDFLSPHMDHNNSYSYIRKMELPSHIISALFKFKNYLFLTEERKFHCGLSSSNRCTHC